MNKLLRWSNRLVVVVGIISLLLAVIAGFQWQRQAKINAFVTSEVTDTNSTHEYVKFHQAEQAAALKDNQLARDIYTELGGDERSSLRADAYYNRGNINLNAALRLRMAHPKRLPLVELAKQDYRTALSLSNTADWDLRYNLALALRQIPEGPTTFSSNPKGPPITGEHQIEVKDFVSELP